VERPEKNKTREFREAGQAVEERGALLKKELGLRDLVLTQILFMVGLGWVGVAAQVGPAYVVFWVLAIILFYIPLAAVVIYLNGLMPLEGGLYQWAKLGFNGFVAFMVAWNLWLYAMTNTSQLGLLTSTNLAYALGARAGWMATSNWLIIISNVVCIGFLVVLSILGLSIGKWVNNAGGVVLLILFASLLALPFISLWRGYYSGRSASSASWIATVANCHPAPVLCNKYTTPARSNSCPSVFRRTATPPAITVFTLSRLRWRLISSLLAKLRDRKPSMTG